MSVAIVVAGAVIATGALGSQAGPALGEVAGAVATPDPSAPEPTDIGGPIFPVSFEPIEVPPESADGGVATVTEGDPGTGASGSGTGSTEGAGSTEVAGSAATPEPTPSLHGPDPATLTGYRWPLAKARITLPFGPSPWGSHLVNGKDFHDGIDLATFCGDRIVAAHAGAVLAAGRHFDGVLGWVGDLGPYTRRLDAKHLWNTLPIVVVIDDGNGYRSMYAHFSKVTVKKGQTVKAGQLLGYEGRTGHASGCHLHYGLYSPQERDTIGIDKAVAKRMKLPRLVIARIDPMLVLPPRKRAPKATEAPSDTSP
jgi:murein DD-endopeptidase MepM/ murein hydrolase activator NlpD